MTSFAVIHPLTLSVKANPAAGLQPLCGSPSDPVIIVALREGRWLLGTVAGPIIYVGGTYDASRPQTRPYGLDVPTKALGQCAAKVSNAPRIARFVFRMAS